MANQFSSGKHAIAECDICAFRFKLSELRAVVVKQKVTSIMACPVCWDKDHPQLMLGMYPVTDPQAVRNPRPDVSNVTSRAIIMPINLGVATQVVVGRITAP